MVGPILNQELLLSSRRGWLVIIRRIFTGWLVFLIMFFYIIYVFNWRVTGDPEAVNYFGVGFTRDLVWQQMILIFLATPAFAAGAVTDEKLRGTLQYLLCADVTAADVVLGKLFGRVIQVGLLSLCALPVICFAGVFGGINLVALVALIAVTVMPMFALASASLLASVWSRQTRDAVIGIYITVLIFYFVTSWLGIASVFNPVEVLEPAWGSSLDLAEVFRRLLLSVLAWGSIAIVCCSLAIWRLRPAYLRQLQGQDRPRKVRWWLARRKAVPDEPIRWKERHVEGIAPFAFLRRIPRWLGMVSVFLITTAACISILIQAALTSITIDEVWRLASHLDFGKLSTPMGPAVRGFEGLGFIAMLLTSALVGLRCSSAVTGERERQTWEALLLTPMPVKELIDGKLRGVIGAAVPYFVAYAAPALVLSLFAGPICVMWTLIWIGISWMAMHFLGAAGLWCSVRAKTSWRSLLWTVGMGYVVGFLLFVVAWPLAGIIMLAFMLTILFLQLLLKVDLMYVLSSLSFPQFFFGTLLFMVAGFLALRIYFIRTAQSYVADRERVRHWAEEPPAPRPRRRVRTKLPAEAEKQPIPPAK
jgi:ABC-type transport system involved in multi-copper enzyme maturation permease subunit